VKRLWKRENQILLENSIKYVYEYKT